MQHNIKIINESKFINMLESGKLKKLLPEKLPDCTKAVGNKNIVNIIKTKLVILLDNMYFTYLLLKNLYKNPLRLQTNIVFFPSLSLQVTDMSLLSPV